MTTTRPLAGSWRLVRLAVRRDRTVLPVWIASITVLTWAVVASYAATVPTEADRIATATLSASNPMTRIFDGPASGASLGAMSLVEGYKVFAILTALMSAQAIVRHTRADEETGRAELLGSAPVGRHARLCAALVLVLGANLVLGVTTATAVAANGLAWSGAWAAGLAVAGTGWVFAGVAAVGAQVLSTARGANAVAGGALGVAFVLRAIGDLRGEITDGGLALVSAWPSWLSPLGWGQQIRPFYQDRWWIAGLFVALTAALVAVAAMLTDRRDLGSGMVPARRGPARASRWLISPLGLAWRIQRGVLLAWLVSVAVFGAVLGSMGDTLEDYLAENATVRQMLLSLSPDADLMDLFFALIMALVGLACAGYTVQALLRMRSEEVSGRLEPLLATAVGRRRWLIGHLLIAGAGTVLLLTVSGLASGLTYGAITGHWTEGVGGFLAAALVQAPAALALGGLVLTVFGLLPRLAAPITWSALAAALVMGQLGALLDLPQWLLDVSPFTHVPLVPAEAFTPGPVAALCAAAILLGALGVATFRRRDLVIGA
ncbi:ABC transporter permease [Actinotalea sp. K2]|uniref:ABC transporter permease n=1 Tax=Actinotalea sp. K2 TaxID=2939438 RepID=UPI002017DD8E|nr:hypothetical protein [Actinotalea sp. K2]MCL3863084.1 hypothetical protein [Actinotalea sp. K2]